MIIMKTKKRYIAPSVDIVTVLQESPLLDFSDTQVGDNTGGSGSVVLPGIGDFAKEHNGYYNWEEYDTDDSKSLWD